jgi:PKHD-type hydroxylase
MDSKLIFPTDDKIDQTNYFIYHNAFNDEQLEWINNLQKMHNFEKASTIGNSIDDTSIRKSSIKWMHHNDKNNWLYDYLSTFALGANDVMWKFGLHSIIDSIQYTEYYEGGGHYDWHIDIGPHPINNRKISITVQLSDPSEYEGGDFELWTGGEFKKMEKIKGCAILFPSFLMHRVTPITKGVRKSLVLWVGGDAFR